MEVHKVRVKMTLWVLTGFGVAIFAMGRLILGKELPPTVPLWYSRPWGESQLASPNNLVIIPALMVAIAILALALLRIWILAL